MTLVTTSTHNFPARKASALFQAISAAFAARKQRKSLKSLDNTQLNDVGLSYRQALDEAKRPIWDVPAYWRR